eukprot:8775348-Pyramimonas_sp.AAC.1
MRGHPTIIAHRIFDWDGGCVDPPDAMLATPLRLRTSARQGWWGPTRFPMCIATCAGAPGALCACPERGAPGAAGACGTSGARGS